MIDWTAVRSEDEYGASRLGLCEKYGLSYYTLDSRIRRNRWNESRKVVALKAHEICTNKIAEEKAQVEISLQQRILETQNQILCMTEDLIDEYQRTGEYTVLDLWHLIRVLTSLQKSLMATNEAPKQEGQLIAVLRGSAGKGADADTLE